MGLVYAWMLASAVLTIVLILVASAAGNHAAVKENTEKQVKTMKRESKLNHTRCDWEEDATASGLFFFMYIIWLWMGNYVTMTQVYYVAGCTARTSGTRLSSSLDAPDAPQARLHAERRHGLQVGLGFTSYQLHQEEQQVQLPELRYLHRSAGRSSCSRVL